MTLLLRLIVIAIVILSILLVMSLMLRRRAAPPRWLTLGYPPRTPRPPLLPKANRGALQVAHTADWRTEEAQGRLGEVRAADGRVLAYFGTEYNMPKWTHAAILEELAQVGFALNVADGREAEVPQLHSELVDARILPAEDRAVVVLGARLLDPEGRERLAERYEESAERKGRRNTEEVWADALERALQKAAQMVAFDVVARLPAPQDDEAAA
jgi:hypothetical protein